jgi:hypothetical protein
MTCFSQEEDRNMAAPLILQKPDLTEMPPSYTYFLDIAGCN